MLFRTDSNVVFAKYTIVRHRSIVGPMPPKLGTRTSAMTAPASVQREATRYNNTGGNVHYEAKPQELGLTRNDELHR